jgi:hypothetical protein
VKGAYIYEGEYDENGTLIAEDAQGEAAPVNETAPVILSEAKDSDPAGAEAVESEEKSGKEAEAE